MQSRQVARTVLGLVAILLSAGFCGQIAMYLAVWLLPVRITDTGSHLIMGVFTVTFFLIGLLLWTRRSGFGRKSNPR
jgi:hypothetical protein